MDHTCDGRPPESHTSGARQAYRKAYPETYREPDHGKIVRLLGELGACEGAIEARHKVLAEADPVLERGRKEARESRYAADPEIQALTERRHGVLVRLGGREDSPLPRGLWVAHGSKLLHLTEDGAGAERSEPDRAAEVDGDEDGDRRLDRELDRRLELYEIRARDAYWVPEGVTEHPSITVRRVEYARWSYDGLRQMIPMLLLPAGGVWGLSVLNPYLPVEVPTFWMIVVMMALVAAGLALFSRGREYALTMWGTEGVRHPYGRFEPGTGEPALRGQRQTTRTGGNSRRRPEKATRKHSPSGTEPKADLHYMPHTQEVERE